MVEVRYRLKILDSHIVEKIFNALLEDYRLEVLPSVVDNWAELSIEEKTENELFSVYTY